MKTFSTICLLASTSVFSLFTAAAPSNRHLQVPPGNLRNDVPLEAANGVWPQQGNNNGEFGFPQEATDGNWQQPPAWVGMEANNNGMMANGNGNAGVSPEADAAAATAPPVDAAAIPTLMPGATTTANQPTITVIVPDFLAGSGGSNGFVDVGETTTPSSTEMPSADGSKTSAAVATSLPVALAMALSLAHVATA